MATLAVEPRIWTSVRFCLYPLNVSGAALVLSRAASHIIRLGFYGRVKDYLGDPDIKNLITTHLPRLDSLAISLNGLRTDPVGTSLDDALRHLYCTLSGSAPFLRLLQLTSTMSSKGRPIYHHWSLPADLFGGATPELRRLVLQGVRLSTWIRYGLLRNLTALHYTSPASTLGQAELQSILHQTVCLVHLTLHFAGYVPEPQDAAAMQSSGEPIMPLYVRLHGFIDGRQEVLRRFAQAPTLAVSFTQQVQLDDFQAWPNAQVRVIALGNNTDTCQELSSTCDSATSPNNCAFVFISKNLSTISFIPYERITTLTVSETYWIPRWNWVAELPQLTELRLILSTCLNRDAKAGSIWQLIFEAGRNAPLAPASSMLSRVTLIANVADKPLQRTSVRNMTCQSPHALDEAACICPKTCCLSLFDVAGLLAILLLPQRRLDALVLIGITDIVDIDLEAAFTAVMNFTNSVDFETKDAIRHEEKGLSAQAMTRDFFPDEDSLRDYELTSPFINSWPLFGFE